MGIERQIKDRPVVALEGENSSGAPRFSDFDGKTLADPGEKLTIRAEGQGKTYRELRRAFFPGARIPNLDATASVTTAATQGEELTVLTEGHIDMHSLAPRQDLNRKIRYLRKP